MKFSTVSDWLDWQSKIHAQSIDMGLDRIRSTYNKLISQKLAKKIIIVGGTNGKGSTTAFLEAMYVAAGYRVGVYTSPHLLHYNERIRLQGEPVSDEVLCQVFDHVETAREGVSITYFEFGTLAAFDLFQNNNLDIAILEVGLGGRLDAVNLVEPDVSVVTNIQLDHESWLGDTREKIAFEKFGIGRANKPLIFADDNPPSNIDELVAEQQLNLLQLGSEFGFAIQDMTWQWWSQNSKKFGLPHPRLKGEHQYRNAATALMATECLAEDLPLSMNHIRVGLAQCQLPGRFQVIPQPNESIIILDVAHNPHGIHTFVNNLQSMHKIGNHSVVLAMLADKSVPKIVEALKPVIDRWYIAGLDVDRGLSAKNLQEKVLQQGVNFKDVVCLNTVTEAVNAAKEKLEKYDKLIIIGSFYTVAEALPLLGGNIDGNSDGS